MFKQQAKLDVLIVKHNGEAAAGAAVAGGHVFAASAALDAFVSGGKLTPLATTGTKRSPLLPQLPTLAEAGVAALTGFIAIAVPKDTPADVQDKLRQSLGAVTSDPEIAQSCARSTLSPFPTRGRISTPSSQVNAAGWAR